MNGNNRSTDRMKENAMVTNNGTNTAVEPEANGAPAADGMEQQGSGQPEGTQSTGNSTPEGGKGTASPAWMAQLPNDLKNEADLQQYATLADYVRSTRAKNDGSEGSGSNTRETKPIQYENFEKSLDADSDPFGVISDSLKTTLQEAGVPEEVAEKVFDAVSAGQEGSTKQLIEKGKDWCEAQLKKTWGDKYDEKRKAMSRAYVALVQPDENLASALDRTGASINPAVADLLARIGESIREDGSFPSNTTASRGKNPKVPVHYPD
jgi:hypothetical protein